MTNVVKDTIAIAIYAALVTGAMVLVGVLVFSLVNLRFTFPADWAAVRALYVVSCGIVICFRQVVRV